MFIFETLCHAGETYLLQHPLHACHVSYVSPMKQRNLKIKESIGVH